MIGATGAFVHWFAVGFKETLAMIWLTWWPLVLGSGLSGLVQSLVPRDALRAQLGTNSPTSVAKGSLLGILSSSCSCAASAMSHALFARGASWSNALRAVGSDGLAYYFCSEDYHRTFLEGPRLPANQRIE